MGSVLLVLQIIKTEETLVINKSKGFMKSKDAANNILNTFLLRQISYKLNSKTIRKFKFNTKMKARTDLHIYDKFLLLLNP